MSPRARAGVVRSYRTRIQETDRNVLATSSSMTSGASGRWNTGAVCKTTWPDVILIGVAGVVGGAGRTGRRLYALPARSTPVANGGSGTGVLLERYGYWRVSPSPAARSTTRTAVGRRKQKWQPAMTCRSRSRGVRNPVHPLLVPASKGRPPLNSGKSNHHLRTSDPARQGTLGSGVLHLADPLPSSRCLRITATTLNLSWIDENIAMACS